MYIYIYREREICIHAYVYIYIYIYTYICIHIHIIMQSCSAGITGPTLLVQRMCPSSVTNTVATMFLSLSLYICI